MATEAPQTAPGTREQPDRPDVFISYSRQDKSFVGTGLLPALTARGKDVWVDLEDIPPAADWRERIWDGIEAARAFVFVLSPASATSEVCREELRRAVEGNKRLIPVLRHAIDPEAVPEALERPNWIFLRDEDDFDAQVERLVEALETDLDWVDAHARLAVRAREWDRSGQDRSLLLRGTDLKAAERWLAEQGSHREAATPDQTEYIVASRHAAARRQRLTLGAVATALVISLALAVLAWSQRQQAVERARVASSRELAATSLAMRDRDPELSVLLGVAASRKAPTEQAEDALRQSLLRWPARRALPHRAGVKGAEYSPDGRFVLTASRDAARLFDAASGRPVRRYLVGAGDVVSARFSPDGRYVVTATDRGATIVETSSAQVVTRLSAGGEPVHGAKFSRNGRRVVMPTLYSARVFDSPSGRQLAKLSPGAFMEDADLSPHGDLAVTFGPNRDVRVWRVSTSRVVSVLRHRQPVVGANISPDGRLIVTATLNGPATVWSLPAGRLIAKLEHFGGVQGASFSPNGHLLFTTGSYGQLWDTRKRRTVGELRQSSRVITSAFSGDGRRVVTGDDDGVARVWDVATQRVVNRLSRHASRVSAVSFSPDGRFVLTASPDRTARVWEATPGSTALELRKDRETIYEARLAPDGRTVFAAGDRGAVRLWDATTGHLEASLKGPGGPLRSVSLSHDGRLLIAGGEAGGARLWRVRDRRPLGTLRGRRAPITDVSLSPDNRYAVTAAADGTVRLWSSSTGRELGRLGPYGERASGADFARGGQRIVAALEGSVVGLAKSPSAAEITAFPHSFSEAVSPDGNTLAIGDFDGVILRRADDGRRLRQLSGSAGTYDLGFAPSGRFLAGVASSGAGSVWDLRSGRRVLHIRQPSVSALTVGPGDEFVAAGHKDGLVRVFELTSGERVATFGERGRGRPYSVEFSADGRFLLAREVGRGAWIYRCEVCSSQRKLLELARERAIRRFTPDERRRYLHNEPE